MDISNLRQPFVSSLHAGNDTRTLTQGQPLLLMIKILLGKTLNAPRVIRSSQPVITGQKLSTIILSRATVHLWLVDAIKPLNVHIKFPRTTFDGSQPLDELMPNGSSLPPTEPPSLAVHSQDTPEKSFRYSTRSCVMAN
jgi:hypothetical protein